MLSNERWGFLRDTKVKLARDETTYVRFKISLELIQGIV